MLFHNYSGKKRSETIKNKCKGDKKKCEGKDRCEECEQSLKIAGNKCGQGLKMASGSITGSLLASWFGFAARGLFSPSEAVIVLLILMGLSFPAKMIRLNPNTIIGEITGLITLLVVELGTCGALLWTFSRLVNTLPTLATDNVVFFFAKVAVNGWFRYFALVYCVIDAATSMRFAWKVFRVSKIVWIHYKSDKDELDNATRREIENIVGWQRMRIETQCLFFFGWVFVVVVVELTVKWNHLSPSTDLQTPG